MKKNILAENMRRFGTKNLKEANLNEIADHSVLQVDYLSQLADPEQTFAGDPRPSVWQSKMIKMYINPSKDPSRKERGLVADDAGQKVEQLDIQSKQKFGVGLVKLLSGLDTVKINGIGIGGSIFKKMETAKELRIQIENSGVNSRGQAKKVDLVPITRSELKELRKNDNFKSAFPYAAWQSGLDDPSMRT